MRRTQLHPKVRQPTPIPDDLRTALREALDIIHESERDPDVCVDYGDAIQTPCLCGGRVGTDKRPYEFTYYHGADRAGSRWRLAFHALEIEESSTGIPRRSRCIAARLRRAGTSRIILNSCVTATMSKIRFSTSSNSLLPRRFCSSLASKASPRRQLSRT